MSTNNNTDGSKLLTNLVAIATIGGVLIAVVAWLLPFSPVGSSPLADQESFRPVLTSIVSEKTSQGLHSDELPPFDKSDIDVQTGYASIGDPSAWIVLQVWDGRNLSTVVHGVIEPGASVQIPAPVVGSVWTVYDISRDSLISRAIEMRQEVVERDKIPEPPLVYVGAAPASQGFTTQLPNGWSASR